MHTHPRSGGSSSGAVGVALQHEQRCDAPRYLRAVSVSWVPHSTETR